MRTLLVKLNVILLISSTLVHYSCKTNKSVVKDLEGKEIYKEPFSSDEYRSDDSHIRYVASEESNDIAVAKSVALIQSQAGLAVMVNKEIEGMFTSYLNFVKNGSNSEAVKHIQSLFDGIVQVRLPNVRVIGEQAFRDKRSGVFTYYVATEIKVSDLEKESMRLAQEDARLKAVVAEKEYREFLEAKLQQRKGDRD